MKKFKFYITSVILLISTVVTSFAQEAGENVEMADAMRSSGKIYVVVAVLVLIMIGIIVFLITLDRKVKRLENQVSNN